MLMIPVNSAMRGKFKRATSFSGKVPEYTITEQGSDKVTPLMLSSCVPKKAENKSRPKYQTVRDQASRSPAFTDTGDLLVSGVKNIAKGLQADAQAEFPGCTIESSLRPAFVPKGPKAPQVNVKVKDAQAVLDKLNETFESAFPEGMEAKDYLDEKEKIPYMDFMNQQVKVGKEITDEKGKKKTVMNPRLSKLWRVTNDSKEGKQIHIVCGPQWPSERPDPKRTKHLVTKVTAGRRPPRGGRMQSKTNA